MSGFDINLKAGAYQNLTFINNTITNNGLGGAKEGVGITVKARDDGAPYGAFPATLSNVSIESSLVAGNERGIRFGEPGKNNAGPTGVTVHNVCISGNVQTYTGTDGSAYGGLVNQSLATVDATNNWWGNASGPNPPGSGGCRSRAGNHQPLEYCGCPLPELGAKTGDALFCVGEQTTVTLDLARIAGLYGYQFEVSYNKDMASAVGAFVNSFLQHYGERLLRSGLEGQLHGDAGNLQVLGCQDRSRCTCKRLRHAGPDRPHRCGARRLRCHGRQRRNSDRSGW